MNTTTAAWVFARAIHLMDEQNETTGETSTADTSEYKLRTLSILNILHVLVVVVQPVFLIIVNLDRLFRFQRPHHAEIAQRVYIVCQLVRLCSRIPIPTRHGRTGRAMSARRLRRLQT